MNFLHSNFPPLKTSFQSFSDKFDELLYLADKVQIATGYISADSIAELNRIVILIGVIVLRPSYTGGSATTAHNRQSPKELRHAYSRTS